MRNNVLVTGSGGFLGRNLCIALSRAGAVVLPFEAGDPAAQLERGIADCDFVVHLAGVNRPTNESEFEAVNVGITREVARLCERSQRPIGIILASSTQAEGSSPYGRSKAAAELVVREYSERTGGAAYIYRLPGLFGKWSRPNYNSVVATFCHNAARGIPLPVNDPSAGVELVHVDDVVAEFLAAIRGERSWRNTTVNPSFRTSVGELARLIESFAAMRDTLLIPDLTDPFTKKLHSTFVSYLDEDDLAFPLFVRTDARGSLADVLKSPHSGQIFVSRTLPGATRGNHYHDAKVERFCVLDGKARISFRRIDGTQQIHYDVDGREYRVLDIPPGYTHSITNTGETEMIVLFWSSEVFSPEHPDTHAEKVEL